MSAARLAVGTRVMIIRHEGFRNDRSQQFVGQHGKVVDNHSCPDVLLDSGSRVTCDRSELALVQPDAPVGLPAVDKAEQIAAALAEYREASKQVDAAYEKLQALTK